MNDWFDDKGKPSKECKKHLQKVANVLVEVKDKSSTLNTFQQHMFYLQLKTLFTLAFPGINENDE